MGGLESERSGAENLARNIWTRGSGPDSSSSSFQPTGRAYGVRIGVESHSCLLGEQQLRGFTECFARAIQSLNESTAIHGYHKDLYCPGSLSRSSEAMLDAAQSAWVFGGMGSWNDMSFDGEKGREYEESSEDLFIAVNDAICVAANESCKE